MRYILFQPLALGCMVRSAIITSHDYAIDAKDEEEDSVNFPDSLPRPGSGSHGLEQVLGESCRYLGDFGRIP